MPVALVVEDHPDLLALHSLALEMARWLVVTAENTSAALDLARCLVPDIVFTDYAMPGGDGLDLAHQLHSLPGLGDIPIVVVTGQPGTLRQRQSNDAVVEVGAVLIKPVTPKRLQQTADTLHRACGRECLGPSRHWSDAMDLRLVGCRRISGGHG